MKRFLSVLMTAALLHSSVGAIEYTWPVTRAQAVPTTAKIKLASPGIKGAIPYKKFGHFEGIGTKNYRYVITDKKGLAEAAGEGIFPNSDVSKDPRFKELMSQGKLAGNHWNFTDLPDSEVAFYKWASVNEDPGVKQFFSAIMLERAGLTEEAIKGFYAVAVHFPKTISYTYYHTPWYVGPAALDRVTQLLRRDPSIKMELRGARIEIQNRFDNDTKNDLYSITPGELVNVKVRKEPKPVALLDSDVVKSVGGPKVKLNKYKNGRWQLLVDGKPFQIRALTYSITPVGMSPDRGTWNPSKDWQTLDTNKNNIHDGFFESYVDKNKNNKRDADEPVVGDAQLIKDLGANTLRVYHHVANNLLFRHLNEKYGLYILCGDLLGGYATGSGATWAAGTDYRNPTQRKNMLDSVRQMVEENKNEPYVLMWVLGNENVYGVANNSGQYPEEFFSLVDEAAELIHKLDPTRPVAIANGDLLDLNVIKEKCPHIDVFGANVYRGELGFGNHLFRDVQEMLDKPVLVTEYGNSAYAEGFTDDEAEAYQAMYIANNWEDLESNMAGLGTGNALGGVLFEFVDEWWKANSDLPEDVQKAKAAWYADKADAYKNLQPDKHEKLPQFGFPFLDGWSYEEWYGLTSQGDGKDSPFLRQTRKSYETMKKVWNK